MGEGADDVRRDLFALRWHDKDSLADPARLSHEVRLGTGADSALVSGGAVIGEEKASRVEIQRLRAEMGRRLRAPRDGETLKENQR